MMAEVRQAKLMAVRGLLARSVTHVTHEDLRDPDILVDVSTPMPALSPLPLWVWFSPRWEGPPRGLCRFLGTLHNQQCAC